MSAFPFPFVIVTSDGKGAMHTLLPGRLGRHRTMIEGALAELLLVERRPAPKAAAAPVTATMTQGEIARAHGYTGDSCLTCGNFMMVRNGTCLKCEACGDTTGCS